VYALTTPMRSTIIPARVNSRSKSARR
jgi:hypothetical protein